MSHPTSRAVEEGDALLFYAAATGPGGVTYHWLKDGLPATRGVPAGGGLNFSVDPAEPQDAGLYTVIASNQWGTATSQPARVVVTPAPPNPDYQERRFVRLAASGLPVVGTDQVLGTSMGHGGARWFGHSLLFTADSPAGQPLGVVAADPHRVRVAVSPGTALPGSAGIARDFALPGGALAEDPLLVMSMGERVDGQPSSGAVLGLHRVTGATLTTEVDRTTPVPMGEPGEGFLDFDRLAVQRGSAVAMLGRTPRRVGLYLAGNGPLRRILDTTMSLPFGGTTAHHLYAAGFDGRFAAVAAWNNDTGFLGVIRVSPDGLLSPVVRSGDRLPRSGTRVTTVNHLAVTDGSVFASTTGDAAGTVFEGGEDGIRRELGPVTEWGAGIPVFELPFLADGGAIYAMAGTLVRTWPVVFERAGESRVLLANKLDRRRTFQVRGRSALLAASAGRVAVLVQFREEGLEIYANAAPVLRHRRLPDGGLELSVPPGMELESASAPDGPWQTVTGSGLTQVPMSRPAAWYRLLEP